MSLSKESISLLRQVKRAILATPELYDQDTFVAPGEECGTTCCIAGWHDRLFMSGSTFRRRVAANKIWEEGYGRFDESPFFVSARKGLRLTEDQAERLFNPPDDWPLEFRESYRWSADGKDRAYVAAARIEHFIKTGGAE